MPTWRELAGERHPETRRTNEQKRDKAAAALMRMYREAVKANDLQRLAPQVREFCESLISYNPGAAAKASRARTGAPDRAYESMQIAVAVALEIERDPKKRGAVERAVKAVAALRNRDYESVRKTYFHCKKDPALKASLAMRKLDELAVSPKQADAG